MQMLLTYQKRLSKIHQVTVLISSAIFY